MSNANTDTLYVGRIAPSPTGMLHLGHARTFWIAAQRATSGTLWLRDDDLDAQRVRSEYAAAMRDDLHWLGIRWQAEVRQSGRLPLYAAAMHRLLQSGRAYPCSCSRRDLAASIAAPHEDADDEPIYSGRCRALVTANARIEVGSNYRLRVAEGEEVSFRDASAGDQRFVAGEDFGDFLVWRKDGLPSYQLACAVDDAEMRITEVVRGRDLLKSTARQILLQRALGFATPHYFHTHLMCDEAGVRLAKRHDALSLRTMRGAGATPADVVARFGCPS